MQASVYAAVSAHDKVYVRVPADGSDCGDAQWFLCMFGCLWMCIGIKPAPCNYICVCLYVCICRCGSRYDCRHLAVYSAQMQSMNAAISGVYAALSGYTYVCVYTCMHVGAYECMCACMGGPHPPGV